MAKLKDIGGLEDGPGGVDEQVAAEIAVAEAKTRAVLRLANRSLLWVAFLVLILYYSIEVVRWFFQALTGVLLVIVLAVFFAYLIAPLVEFARRPFRLFGQKRELPRWLAISVVYVALFGSLTVGAWVLLPQLGNQLGELAKSAPTYLTNARERAVSLNDFYRRMNLPPAVRDYANGQVNNTLDQIGGYVRSEGVGNAVHFLGKLPWLVLVPILAFFFLKDADAFRRSALRILPQGRLRWRGDEFFQDVNSTLAAYIRAQLIACLLIGTICTGLFLVLGLRYALVLGVVAGMLEFIPLLGPVTVAIIAGLVGSFDSGGKAVLVLLLLGALRIFHDYFTYPRIIGSGIHLHPLAVILSILAGHELAGVAGIFLAIPVVAILTVTHRHWLEHRGSSGLVADLLKPADETVKQTPSAETDDVLPDSDGPAAGAPAAEVPARPAG
ncbi:MAG TPA: AI-2E family transporter [Pyrinomonadaceae bacterium]|nr:AI-2E family transporter [Pyrinomonadaceae bacterium]